MRFALLLALWLSDGVALPQEPCDELTKLYAARSGYTELNAAPFEGRVFVYVPNFKGEGTSFRPFTLWVVEGIYGRPFVKPLGRLDEASFEKLRGSANVRVTPLKVIRGDGSDTAKFKVDRVVYRLVVLRVSSGLDLRVCR